MAAVGAEWVAIVPYAFGPGEDGRLQWNAEGWQWWGETEHGTPDETAAYLDPPKTLYTTYTWLYQW